MSSRTSSPSPAAVAAVINDELRSKTNTIVREGSELIDQEKLIARQRIGTIQSATHAKLNDLNDKSSLASTKLNEASRLQSAAVDKMYQAREIVHEAPSHLDAKTRMAATNTYSQPSSSISTVASNEKGGGIIEGMKDAVIGIKNDIVGLWSPSYPPNSSSSSSASISSAPSTSYTSTSSSSPRVNKSSTVSSSNIVGGVKDTFIGIRNDIASTVNSITHPSASNSSFLSKSSSDVYVPDFVPPPETELLKYQPSIGNQILYEERDLNSPSTLHALHPASIGHTSSA